MFFSLAVYWRSNYEWWAMQKAMFSAQKKAFSDPVSPSGMLGHPVYACSGGSVDDTNGIGPKN